MSEYVMGEAGKVSEKVTPMNPDELLNALATIEAFRGDGYRAGRASLLPLVKELWEALDNYGEHRLGCAKVYRSDRGECGCGLESMLDRATLVQKERGGEEVPGADVCCHGIAIDEYCDFCHGGKEKR